MSMLKVNGFSGWTLGCLGASLLLLLCFWGILKLGSLWFGMSSEDRTNTPLDLQEARKDAGIKDFPFPSSAHDIYYAQFACWQDYESLVRFQAPVKDCLASIPAVLKWARDDGSVQKPASYHPIHLKAAAVLPDSDDQHPVPWFERAVITHGVYAGWQSVDTPKEWWPVDIWIDTDKGVFYFKQTH
jgi:hypothetical protein